MSISERRVDGRDRRSVSRGGRRDGDQPRQFPNLLVADSYDGARMPCVRYLNCFGFHVDEAVDGHEALIKVDAAPPHVILVASALPKVPVAEIVKRLRAQPHTERIPVIVMAGDPEWGAGGVAGAPLVSVLAKPFALAIMLQEVRRLLRDQPPVFDLQPVSVNAGADADLSVPLR